MLVNRGNVIRIKPPMPHIACDLEFGSQFLHLRLPPQTALLALPRDPALPDPKLAPSATRLIIRWARRRWPNWRAAKAAHPAPRAVIVVSDNTRPVPYKEPGGILLPIIETRAKRRHQPVEILVANGTHRPADRSRTAPAAAVKYSMGKSPFIIM